MSSTKLAIALLGLASIAAIAWSSSLAYARMRTYRATIAAGNPTTESYVLMQALKTVVERHHPRLKLTMVPTDGTPQSLIRLARREVQFAVAEADERAGLSSRTVALLYKDLVQILVPRSSEVRSFADLRGKRIALPRFGGQYQSFLFLARHVGLRDSDFSFTGSDDDSAGGHFASKEADALFVVRALHTERIARLTVGGNVRFIPIDAGPALRLEIPAFGTSGIPKDAYQSDPPVPEADIPTISVDRLLLTRADIPKEVVFTIAQVLMERRQEIAAAIPEAQGWVRQLAASVKPPNDRAGLFPPLHPGAALYYGRGELTFSEAELVAACAVGFLFLGLWLLIVKVTVRKRQKFYSDQFNDNMMKLVEEAQFPTPQRPIGAIRAESVELLTGAMKDLCEERISEQSFESSRVVWQIAYQFLREGAPVPAIPEDPPASPPQWIPPDEPKRAAGPKQRRWSMWRDA